MIAPIAKVTKSGNISIGLIPSSDLGRGFVIFLKKRIMYPDKKPATNAPRNPAPPVFAKYPPTKPTVIPGLSAIDIPINPARTGNIKPKAAPPI